MPQPTLLTKINCDSGGELSVDKNFYQPTETSPGRAKMAPNTRLPPILHSVDFSGGPTAHLQSTKNSEVKKIIS